MAKGKRPDRQPHQGPRNSQRAGEGKNFSLHALAESHERQADFLLRRSLHPQTGGGQWRNNRLQWQLPRSSPREQRIPKSRRRKNTHVQLRQRPLHAPRRPARKIRPDSRKFPQISDSVSFGFPFPISTLILTVFFLGKVIFKFVRTYKSVRMETSASSSTPNVDRSPTNPSPRSCPTLPTITCKRGTAMLSRSRCKESRWVFRWRPLSGTTQSSITTTQQSLRLHRPAPKATRESRFVGRARTPSTLRHRNSPIRPSSSIKFSIGCRPARLSRRARHPQTTSCPWCSNSHSPNRTASTTFPWTTATISGASRSTTSIRTPLRTSIKSCKGSCPYSPRSTLGCRSTRDTTTGVCKDDTT